jgi:hypothetical protein
MMAEMIGEVTTSARGWPMMVDKSEPVKVYLMELDTPCQVCSGVMMTGSKAARHPSGWQHPHHVLGVTHSKIGQLVDPREPPQPGIIPMEPPPPVAVLTPTPAEAELRPKPEETLREALTANDGAIPESVAASVFELVDSPSMNMLAALLSHERKRTRDAVEARDACLRENSRLALENQQLKVDRHRGLENFDYDALDPGIRTVVLDLHANGFETTDSGDGYSKPADWYASGEAMSVANVSIPSTVERMIVDSHRVQVLLGREWVVQATYATDTCSAILICTKDADARARS